MIKTLEEIEENISRFKVCEICNSINLLENKECTTCQGVYFEEDLNGEKIKTKIIEEYSYAIMIEGKTIEETDKITYIV